MIAEHGQAFLEAELEPVAAGDAITGPVVEVLVAHHTLNVGVVDIGGGGLVGQHILGVEDVEALVFHGAHVEVAGGHNHESIQIERQTKTRFVPHHGRHQGVHRVFGLVHVTGTHIDLQQMLLAGARRNALFAADQQARDQGKQIAWFFMRVHPGRKVAILIAGAVQRALGHQVAVAEQHRIFMLIGAQGDGVTGHHIGAVQKIRDAAKALGFTLGKERFIADVQTHQLGVLERSTGGENFQLKSTVGRQVVEHQLAAFDSERGTLTVD